MRREDEIEAELRAARAEAVELARARGLPDDEPDADYADRDADDRKLETQLSDAELEDERDAMPMQVVVDADDAELVDWRGGRGVVLVANKLDLVEEAVAAMLRCTAADRRM